MSFLKKLFIALTRAERKTLIIAVAVAVLSAALAIGTFVVVATKAVPAAGGSFTEGMVGQPEYVNPVTAQTEADRALVKLIYSNLPSIADSIQTSSDGKTWTVRLKPDLRWQDGQKLTSDDVIFTVQSIQNPDANSPLAAAWQGVAVSRTSELELTFSLANPYAFFSTNLDNLYITPKHLFADVPPGNWHFSEYNLKPIGSGSYEASSYDQRGNGFITKYHLVAWDGALHKALIQNFDIAFFPNQDDAIKGFNTAQIDGLAVSPDDIASLNRPTDIFSWRTPSYYAVFLNQGANAALADPAARLALSLAIDRTQIENDALGSYGKPTWGPVPPDAPYYAAFMTTSSRDAAAAALQAGGWQLNDSGVPQKTIQKATTTLNFTLTVPDIPFLVKTAQELQASWQSIGAQIAIATDTPENIAQNQVTNRSYDAILYGNALGPNSDLYAFWDSAERFAPGMNLALYHNPADDALMASIRTTMSDASRTAMFAKLESDIASSNSALFLYSPDYLYVTAHNVRGIDTSAPLVDPADRFNQIPQWYLNTTRVLK